MYGQEKRGQSGEIKLINLGQLDRENNNSRRSSRSRRRRRRRSAWSRKSLLQKSVFVLGLVILLVAAGFFSGVRFVLANGSTQENVVIMEEQLSSGAESDMGAENSAAGEIVLLEEQAPKTPVVIIDPGHGGSDIGCSRDGVAEGEINLQLALLLAEKLHNIGIDAVLTREDNETFLTLEERVQIADAGNGDVLVSIHQNSYEEKDNSIEGIETWYSTADQDSRRLAQLVNMGAVDKTGAKERGLVESEELYVIREVSMPACLIETSFLTNAGERAAISDPAYQEKVAEGIAWGLEYYFYPKTMYLTFDDGPSEENTTAVLDILKERGIHATFFVVGENVRKHPDVARRIVAEGHTIGIHCYHHSYDELYASVDSFLEDFQEAYDAVYETTGVEVQLFRFPGGSVNAYNQEVYEEIIAEMAERGYIYFDWNSSLEDASRDTTPGQLIQNARESTLGRKRIVMLAHDIVYNTTQCLGDLIDQFPEYRMEPLTPEVAPIQF